MLRLIDRMCPTHVLKCRDRWPGGATWQELRDRCLACRIRSEGLPDCRALPDLPRGVYRTAMAIHEAAHAVIGTVGGIPVVWARLSGRGSVIHGAEASVQFDPSWSGPVSAWFEALWAGQEAADRYLCEAGFGSDANRLDLRFLARNDACAHDETRRHFGIDVPDADGLCEARGLVAEHWSWIGAVAAVLLERGEVGQSDINDVAPLGCPA